MLILFNLQCCLGSILRLVLLVLVWFKIERNFISWRFIYKTFWKLNQYICPIFYHSRSLHPEKEIKRILHMCSFCNPNSYASHQWHPQHKPGNQIACDLKSYLLIKEIAKLIAPKLYRYQHLISSKMQSNWLCRSVVFYIFIDNNLEPPRRWRSRLERSPR